MKFEGGRKEKKRGKIKVIKAERMPKNKHVDIIGGSGDYRDV